jgi:hypothetical protein
MSKLRLLAAALALSISGRAEAVPGVHPYVEDPKCDAHSITLGHELGNPPVVPYGPTGPFPDPEAIASKSTTANLNVCTTSTNDPTIPDYEVTIKNLTPTFWTDLFFVADVLNSFSNFDGVIDGGLAMKLDTVGVNTPLIAEIGGVIGLVFEPGEEWVFIVEDWADLQTPGGPPHLFNSIGVGVGSPAPPSTASIVADPIRAPEPVGLAVFALLMAVLTHFRRFSPSRRLHRRRALAPCRSR